jgi:hypothetical protein
MWLAAIIRWFRVIQAKKSGHDAAAAPALACALTTLAISLSVSVPSHAAWLDRVANWPNLADFTKLIAVTLSATANLVFVSRLLADRSKDAVLFWATAMAGAVIMTAAILFFAAGRLPEVAVSFGRVYASRPLIAESRLLVTFYAVVVLSMVAWVCIKHRVTSTLGFGVSALGIGSAVMVVYGISRLFYIGGRRSGIAVSDDLWRFGSYTSNIGVVAITVGTLVPPIEEWWRARRELRLTGPLWEELGRPQPFSARPANPWESASYRLTRRVTQVQDALSLLASQHGIVGQLGLVGTSDSAVSRLADWIRSGGTTPISAAEFRPGVSAGSERSWVLALAKEFPQTKGKILTITVQPRVAGRIITEVFSPGLVNIGLPLAIGAYAGSLGWGLVASFTAGIVPYLGILGAMFMKRASDHHVTSRAQRPAIMAFILSSLIAGIVVQYFGDAPRAVLAMSFSMLATLLVLAIITIVGHWKVSIHSAVVPGAIAMLVLTGGIWWMLALVLTPVVAWARVQVGEHTAHQVWVGALVGLLLPGPVFWLVR